MFAEEQLRVISSVVSTTHMKHKPAIQSRVWPLEGGYSRQRPQSKLSATLFVFSFYSVCQIVFM